MAIHSSILSWRIPWTEEPGRLQSKGSRRVGHDWTANTFHFSSISGLLCLPLYHKRLGAGKLHFSELPCKMDGFPSESAHAQSWQEIGRKDKGERHHIVSSASGSTSSIAARMEGRKTKIRKIPGLILRNTVLTTPGGGYDGGNHATPTPRLWARILVTTRKEQAWATSWAGGLQASCNQQCNPLGRVIFPYYSSSPESRSFLYLLITLDPHIPLIFLNPFTDLQPII